MAQLEITARVRKEIGGKRPRQLRRSGLIPGVLYGGEEGAIPLSLEREYLEKKVGVLHENQILRLKLEGKEKATFRPAMVKEIQKNHLTDDILHIDFQGITLDEKLTATVPVVDVGEPVGVTRDGGILEHVLREIEIKCLPAQIPEDIEVDVSSLEIGDSIQVQDIKLGEEVEVLTDPELSVFTVSAPLVEEVVEEEVAPEVIEEEAEKEEEVSEKEGEGNSGKGKETTGKEK